MNENEYDIPLDKWEIAWVTMYMTELAILLIVVEYPYVEAFIRIAVRWWTK